MIQVDPDQIKSHLANDSVLAPLIERLPFPVLEEREVFASLISSIVSQQLSTKAASTIHGRLLDLFPASELDPEGLLAIPFDDLRAVGLSRQKSTYVQNVSEFFMEHQLLQADWMCIRMRR